MKFLCLAYGDERDWKMLSKDQQDLLLAKDEELRKRGALMAAVQNITTTVTAWDGKPTSVNQPYCDARTPLAGFSIIEADSVEEVVRLVAGTPCARAKGAIEVRPILTIND